MVAETTYETTSSFLLYGIMFSFFFSSDFPPLTRSLIQSVIIQLCLLLLGMSVYHIPQNPDVHRHRH